MYSKVDMQKVFSSGRSCFECTSISV